MKRSLEGGVDRTANLKALFAASQTFVMVDLYEVTLLTLGYPLPLTLRWCDWQHDIPFEGVTWFGGSRLASTSGESGPRIQRGQIKHQLGVEVDTLDVTLMLDGTDLLPPADGNPATSRFGLAEAVKGGLFEGARVTLRRLFLPAPPSYPLVAPFDTSCGAVTLFGGQITESKLQASTVYLGVKSSLERLNIGMPRNVFQASCLDTLYDGMCRVSRTGTYGGNAFQHVGEVTVNAGGSLLVFTVGNPAVPHPANYFQFGTVQFTDGVMAGLRRTIRSQAGGSVELLTPLPRAPVIGDGAILQAGCDKTKAMCIAKFNNWARFRGFPEIPSADNAI